MVLTVWALAILAVIVGEIVFSSRLKIRADMHLKRQVQSYGLALAAYHAALDVLGEDLTGLSRDDEGRLLLHRGKDDPGVVAEADGVTLGEGTYSFSIEDEDGKIDINRQARPGLAALFRKAGLAAGVERDGLVDSILDWRDPNREHHLNGAEEDYYGSLADPYSSKDGPLDVVEEILLVKGMKPEYLFGGTVDESTFLPVGDWITVYPATFNPATATDEVLEVLRRSRPSAAAPPRVSQYYTIVASGKAGEDGLERRIKAVVRRRGGGSKIDFQLLYWNDNHYPQGSEHAVD